MAFSTRFHKVSKQKKEDILIFTFVPFLKNSQAILHLVLDNNVKQAFACWEEFTHIREDFNRQPSLEEDILKEVVSDFEKFKEVVNLLKDDIKEIQALQGEKALK